MRNAVLKDIQWEATHKMKNFFDYDTAKAVYYVYLYKNITKAGDKLGLTQSAMSRRIQMAEERCGLLIFERGFHEMTPTKQGARYIEGCKEILHIGDATLKDAHALVGTPKNELRILSTPSMATSWLPIALKGFREAHPEIHLKIISEAKPLDILDTDILISLYMINNDSLNCTRLYDQVQGLFASKEYLDRKGVPEKIEDLDKHDLLAIDLDTYGNQISANWPLHLGIGNTEAMRLPAMQLNSNDGRYNAILNGHGIGSISLQYYKLMKPPGVQRVLPRSESEPVSVHFYFNGLQRNTDQHKKVLGFIQKHIKANPQIYC